MVDLTITKTVTHDSLPGASVTVRPATYRQGLTRTILIEQARKAQGSVDMDNAQELGSAVGAGVIYPSLIAATVEHDGFEHWPPTTDEVMDMPEGFVSAWEVAVFALNPQWKAIVPDEQEKKG